LEWAFFRPSENCGSSTPEQKSLLKVAVGFRSAMLAMCGWLSLMD
jgi:hypothetical protein